MSRNNAFVLIIIAFCLASLEFISFVAGNYLIPASLIFNPGFSAAERASLLDRYDVYLQERDPELGWPTASWSGWQPKRYPSGNRYVPGRVERELPADGSSRFCVSAYGDSFTWSAEVSGAEAWPYLLSQALGCEVANFGIGGYGSDQAYLYYLNNEADDAKVVFLNHLSENILRNTGQFRSLSYGYEFDLNMTMFKPRFIIDDDNELKLIELPDIARDDYIDFLYNPEKYLPYEYFLPGGNSGLERFEFPYTWSLVRTLKHFHVAAELAGEPWYMDFYAANHPSNGLQVTARILETFEQTAWDRGQIPVVSVIPTGNDLEYFVAHQTWPYQSLLDLMAANEVDTLNFGVGIMARLGDTDPCSLFADCSSHFNATGYRYLAEIAYEELERRDLLKLLATHNGAEEQ